jgi:hypothetical protein
MKKALRSVCVALACAVALAACGSSGKSSAAASGGSGQGIEYADCMRKHGVPNFPDPTFGPGGRAIRFKVRAGAFGAQSAAINLANKACAHIGTPLPLGGLVRP